MISTSPHPHFKDKEDRLKTIETFFKLIRKGITASNVLVNISSLGELETGLNAIGSWNTFNPLEVLEAAKKIWDCAGEEVQIGFEGSPVLYIQVPLWAAQIRKNKHLRRPITQEEYYKYRLWEWDDLEELGQKWAEITGNRRLSEEERDSIKDIIFEAFASTNPTESDYNKRHRFPAIPFSIRLWWD